VVVREIEQSMHIALFHVDTAAYYALRIIPISPDSPKKR
jgi:hypothetical protein